jgi:hypothetical protein
VQTSGRRCNGRPARYYQSIGHTQDGQQPRVRALRFGSPNGCNGSDAVTLVSPQVRLYPLFARERTIRSQPILTTDAAKPGGMLNGDDGFF